MKQSLQVGSKLSAKLPGSQGKKQNVITFLALIVRKKYHTDTGEDKSFLGAAFCRNQGVSPFKRLMNNTVGSFLSCPLPKPAAPSPNQLGQVSNPGRPCFWGRIRKGSSTSQPPADPPAPRSCEIGQSHPYLMLSDWVSENACLKQLFSIWHEGGLLFLTINCHWIQLSIKTDHVS